MMSFRVRDRDLRLLCVILNGRFVDTSARRAEAPKTHELLADNRETARKSISAK